MSGVLDGIVLVFTIVVGLTGLAFFTAGTIGLLRMRGLRTRLHALTKADTLGLGLVLLALAPHVGSFAAVVKLVLLWLLAVGSATVTAHVLARREAAEKRQDRP